MVATFFEPGSKLDEKSIENGLECQKCSVGRLFWGGYHRPNSEFHLLILPLIVEGPYPDSSLLFFNYV